MSQNEDRILLDARETSPVITADNSGFGYARGTKRSELVVQTNNEEWYAIEGGYATLSNATPGTGITSQASITAYDATKDVLHILNSETSRSLIIKYVKMFVGTVPGGSGTQKYEFRLDTQTGLTSGGTALTAKRSNLAVVSPLSNVVATAGAMTTVAGSANMEKTYSGEARNGVGLAGDEFIFIFGGQLAPGSLLPVATTTQEQRVRAHGPLIVRPGGSLRMSHYGASLSTAGVYEWEIGCIVR